MVEVTSGAPGMVVATGQAGVGATEWDGISDSVHVAVVPRQDCIDLLVVASDGQSPVEGAVVRAVDGSDRAVVVRTSRDGRALLPAPRATALLRACHPEAGAALEPITTATRHGSPHVVILDGGDFHDIVVVDGVDGTPLEEATIEVRGEPPFRAGRGGAFRIRAVRGGSGTPVVASAPGYAGRGFMLARASGLSPAAPEVLPLERCGILRLRLVAPDLDASTLVRVHLIRASSEEQCSMVFAAANIEIPLGAVGETYRGSVLAPGHGVAVFTATVRHRSDAGADSVALEPAPERRVRIVDPAGRPLPACRVLLFGLGEGDSLDSVLTDRSGEVGFRLAPGLYEVLVLPDAHPLLRRRLDVVDRNPAREEWTVPAPSSVSGFLALSDGTPVANTWVDAFQRGRHAGQVLTDPDGRFEFAFLSADGGEVELTCLPSGARLVSRWTVTLGETNARLIAR